jgi:ubiquinone/menaquinone biosynthesis C-methylase UbiE
MEIGLQEVDRLVQAFWDVDVRAWNSHWMPIFRRFAVDVVRDAELSSGRIALDIGTGPGVAAIEAAQKVRPGGLVLALDRSQAMLDYARSAAIKTQPKNILFFNMDAEHMQFPDELFDVVMSNCGISYATFSAVISEAFRVLRKGGFFVLNDWHLKDVLAHRTFGDILQLHRTKHPSEKLRSERAAIATFERTGGRYSNVRELTKELRTAGFTEVRTKYRNYRIQMRGVQEFLDMRLERAALKHELRELSQSQRARLMDELKKGLKSFIHKGRFVFDWKVAYVKAKKPE